MGINTVEVMIGNIIGNAEGTRWEVIRISWEELQLGPQKLFVLLMESYGKYHWEDGHMGIFNGNCDYEVMILCESQSLWMQPCLLKGSETEV